MNQRKKIFLEEQAKLKLLGKIKALRKLFDYSKAGLQSLLKNNKITKSEYIKKINYLKTSMKKEVKKLGYLKDTMRDNAYRAIPNITPDMAPGMLKMAGMAFG
jgi:hypothetical protein